MTPLEDKIKWSKYIAVKIEPIDFYEQHYARLTRGQLQKQDPRLYQRLWRDGLLEHVPTKTHKSK
jgi:hypothetical protein